MELTLEQILSENKVRTNKFRVLGEFTLINNGATQEERFFIVYFHSSEASLDIYLNDITKIKITENISTENKLKHKILSKIAHEFKTPLNSILGLIKNLKESNYNKNTYKDLDLIQALSNYTIYLIRDVIQYVSNKTQPYQLSQSLNLISDQNQFFNNFYNVNNEKVSSTNNFVNSSLNNLRNYSNTVNYGNNNNNFSSVIKRKIEIKKSMFFCFDILNLLLSCHGSKKTLIKTELLIENSFNDFEILNDEIRINQIILNFISNSIKFTRKGKIAIVTQFVKRSDLNLNNNENYENLKTDKDKENNTLCKSRAVSENNIPAGTSIPIGMNQPKKINSKKLINRKILIQKAIIINTQAKAIAVDIIIIVTIIIMKIMLVVHLIETTKIIIF